MASSSSPTRIALSVVYVCWLFHFCILFSVSVDARTDDDAQGALNDVKALIHVKKCITSDPLSLLKDWHWDDHDDAAPAVARPPNACNWTGISCSTKHPGRVVEIFLQNATLRGSMSPHLSNLSFLQVLNISSNTFSGKIPSSLGTLQRLKVLDLCINEFEGGIPYQLGNLSSLQILSLCKNWLSGEIPQSLAKLQNLKEFNVFQNQFGGQAPSWLGALNKLEELRLGENNIQGVIPAELGNLSASLNVLDLGQNHLTGLIPCSLAGLYHLTELYIEQNNLSGTIPPCLRNLTALTKFDVSVNNLKGNLPRWIGSSFNNLQELSLFSNGFTGNIPHSWRNLTHLQRLKLAENRLSGTPPSWLGTLCSELRWLNMRSNCFTSGVRRPWQSIPILNALSNCSLLAHLSISVNHLTGTLPPTFGSFLPSLQYLGLQDNFISGNIPPSMGNLSSAFALNLHDNLFSGTIPRQIANAESLQVIGFSRNKLQGIIPTEVSLLNKSLGYLFLSENMLSGSIPANIGKLVNLRKLYLARNLLSGKVPSEMGNCPVLEDLVLSANNLSGPIPPEVAGIKTIVFSFDLSSNALTGEVPPEIGGLQMAQFINLSRNQLSGKIAFYMDSWLDARKINLSLNNFSGNLSKSIGSKLTQLQSIDLSRNNFTGPVPVSLLNHSALNFLNFSYNSFDAEVPCLHNSFQKLRLTRWSFLGNTKLCGRCFGLKACPVSPQQHSSHSNKNNILKIVLGILGGLLLLVVAGILFIFRGVKISKGKTPGISEKFVKISVEELRRATDNFSASNLVGEGSHGKVYRGVLSSGMVVAVKCFSSANQSGTDKSFRKECHALRKVRHRNILKIITVVCWEEIKMLVMPFMSNGSLHSLLHHRENGQFTPLKLPIRVKILTELAMGLSYLHHDCDFEVIHCDIKPENVLLDDDMTVKLSDFGISCLMGGDLCYPTGSSSSVVKGSVGYIAPEYGIGERISVKGDVYSFGVVTLEVITRLKPTNEMFSGDLTLPLWIFMALERKSKEERREIIKNIINTVDKVGGIEMDKDDEISVIESILMLGLRCTCPNASVRPSMQEVVSFLQSISPANPRDQRIIPRNLEEVLRVVESQPSFYHKRAEAISSTLSSSD